MTTTNKIEFGVLYPNYATPTWPDADGEIHLKGAGYRSAVATTAAQAEALQEDLLEYLPADNKLYRRETVSHVSADVEVTKPIPTPTRFGAVVRAIYCGVPVLATRADTTDAIPWRIDKGEDIDSVWTSWAADRDLTVTEVLFEGVEA